MVSTIEHCIPQDPFEQSEKAILEAAQRNKQIWLKVLCWQPNSSQTIIGVFARRYPEDNNGIALFIIENERKNGGKEDRQMMVVSKRFLPFDQLAESIINFIGQYYPELAEVQINFLGKSKETYNLQSKS